MPPKTIVLLFLGLIQFNAFPQEKEEKKHDGTHHVYMEMYGTGGRGRTFNYEYLFFKKEQFKLLGRVGLGGTKRKDFTNSFNPDISIPFGINAIYGTKHHIEFGIGQNIRSKIDANTTTWEPERFTKTHANFTIGYRYQTDHGLLIRVSYTPLIEFYTRLTHWAGLSIGYTF
jgi:hypothetical protein